MDKDGGVTSTVARLPALVPPPAELPPRAAALRALVREFLAAERAAGAWAPRADVWLSGWDERFTKELARRGWLGMTIPVEYGGHGASPLDRYVVTEELLAAGAPVAAHWVADRQIGPTLLRFGKIAPKLLEPALVVTADLATKTGDVSSAAALLAKALVDPAKAAGKLAKSGANRSK